MKRFTNNQRIKVTDPESPIRGMCGTVERIRISDGGAWVNMDDPLPKGEISFHDPKDSRYNHTMLYPDQCEPWR
jgi:hypothetical protein